MDQNCDIILVGFEDEENIGLLSLEAYLKEKKVVATIISFKNSNFHHIISDIIKMKPKIIGISLIFQRMLYDFVSFIDALRKAGIFCHITCGGHFPSLEPEKTLKEISGLDSIIRHEGEETLYELYKKLDDKKNWHTIKGLAFWDGEKVQINEARPLIKNLDTLPRIIRKKQRDYVRGLKVASITASRGCLYNCSFCSIQSFYKEPEGMKRRSRSAKNLVDEIDALYSQGIKLFVFKDDDFGMKGENQKKWVSCFIDSLRERKLDKQISFRISCRVDEIQYDILNELKSVGLISVYIGIESGSDTDLKVYNKSYTVENIFHSIDILNQLSLPFEFGFMVFNPESTLQTVKENVNFLSKIPKESLTVIGFTKMLPYNGTPIHKKLTEEERLIGNIAYPDYKFLDERLDYLQQYFTKAFFSRNFDSFGLANKLRFVKLDAILVNKYYSEKYDGKAYLNEIREIIYDDNLEVVEKMQIGIDFLEHVKPCDIEKRLPVLDYFVQDLHFAENRIHKKLDYLMSRYK